MTLRSTLVALLFCVSACAEGRTTAGDVGRRDARGLDAEMALDASLDASVSMGDANTSVPDAVTVGTDAACSGSTRCGATCVNTLTDPAHCGACSVRCTLANASVACAAGTCALVACNGGFANCNGVVADGCERAVSCVSGAACMTSCGTTGALRCTDPCAPTCSAPAEACNLIDDDCDGACDNAGCRRGVHRSVNGSTHFYTTDRAESSCCGFTTENYDYFFLMNAAAPGAVPLYRCFVLSTGTHLYTTNASCEGATIEGVIGHIATSPTCGAIPLYRLLGATGDNFYTTSAPERDSAAAGGYTFVGIAGYVWAS